MKSHRNGSSILGQGRDAQLGRVGGWALRPLLLSLLVAGLLTIPAPAHGQPACENMVIAHRGGWFGFTEGGRNNFGAAIAAGVARGETDLRVDKQGTIWVMHDAKIDRTTTGRGAIANLTTAQVRAATLNDGEQIPTAAQMLSYLSRKSATFKIFLHDKTLNTAARKKLARRIAQYGMKSRTFMMGSKSQMAQSRRLIPGVRRIDSGPVVRSNVAHESGVVRPIGDVTAAEVRTVHSVGYWKLFTSLGANTVGEWDKARRLNVDYLFIDDVRAYRAYCAGRSVGRIDEFTNPGL